MTKYEVKICRDERGDYIALVPTLPITDPDQREKDLQQTVRALEEVLSDMEAW